MFCYLLNYSHNSHAFLNLTTLCNLLNSESVQQTIQVLIRTQVHSFNQLPHNFEDILQNFLDGNLNDPDCI